MAAKNKCMTRSEENEPCKEPYFISIKVRVFHPNSNRRTWQTWKFCKKHFSKFLEEEGQGWYWKYNDESKPTCPVIDFKLPFELEKIKA